MTSPVADVAAADIVRAVDSLHNGFAAASAGPITEATKRVGDATIALRLTPGWAAPPGLAALDHLPDSPNAPVAPGDPGNGAPPPFTISAWDTATTGVLAPELPPPGSYRLAAADLHLAVFGDPLGAEAIDLGSGTAVTWAANPASLPEVMRYRPFAQLAARALPARGLAFLHAAAVVADEGAVLLVGRGGAGKSTTTLACTARGLGLVGDDFCALADTPEPTVLSLYRSVKLRADSTGPLGFGSPPDTAGDTCLLVDVADTVVAAPVRAVVALRPGRSDARLTPIAAANRRGALMSTGLLSGIAGEASTRPWLRAVHVLAEHVPMYALDLSWDLDTVTQLVVDARHGIAHG